jgi:hypothetical protein
MAKELKIESKTSFIKRIRKLTDHRFVNPRRTQLFKSPFIEGRLRAFRLSLILRGLNAQPF